MKTKTLPADHANSLAAALQVLQAGDLVAFPTDTVYGVGALVQDATAIDKLYRVKGRNTEKAIPVLLGDMAQLPHIADDFGSIASRLAERFWPGPLTLVVSKNPSLPGILSPYPTIGIRMPDHPVALALLKAAGPLAVTSANLSGAGSVTTTQAVLVQLGGRIPLILDGGETPGGNPSTVVDCIGVEPVILRPGPLTIDDLLAALE